MKRQAGMTLIELVIVIIVLGIIAAVAAPRFVNIQGNAMTAGLAGSLGAFKSAVTITIAEQRDPQPTWGELEANIDGFDITGTGTATVDLDGDAAADLTITGYSDAACTTAHADEVSATLSWGDGTDCFNL